jgi:inorganic pyrophosphatase
MIDQHELDQKVLAVPNRNPRFDEWRTVEQVFPHVLREIEYFFNIYKELEGKHPQISGWKGPKVAKDAIRAARKQYLEKSNR